MRTSKWIKLAGIGLALLLIPRRSSRNPIIKPEDNPELKPQSKNSKAYPGINSDKEKQTPINKD